MQQLVSIWAVIQVTWGFAEFSNLVTAVVICFNAGHLHNSQVIHTHIMAILINIEHDLPYQSEWSFCWGWKSLLDLNYKLDLESFNDDALDLRYFSAIPQYKQINAIILVGWIWLSCDRIKLHPHISTLGPAAKRIIPLQILAWNLMP